LTTESARMRRVNEALREVISLGLGELKDPRIGFVTVTGVRTRADLRHATVFVSVLGSERRKQRTLEALESARGVLQARVNHELHLKRTPQLAFEYDRTADRAAKLSRLIDDLSPEDRDAGGARGDR
jgi:ribosome-binding factor A